MLHPPQSNCTVNTPRCHHCALGVKSQANYLSRVAPKSVETSPSLCTPQLRGGGRGGEGDEYTTEKMPPTDFAGLVKRASSYLISAEKRTSVDYSPVGGPLPIWIIEGKSIHHILVAFQGQQLLTTLPSPHLARPVIAPSYETEEERWTLSCKRNGVHDTYDEPDLLMAILVSGRMCVLSTLNSWNCLPWGSPSLPWSSAEREEGSR